MIKRLADTLSDLVKLIHFDEHNWYLLYSPLLSLSRSLRVSKSLFLTLYHTGTVLNRFVFEK